MAITPQAEVALYALENSSWPTETWKYDKQTGRLAGKIDGVQAVEQAITIALQVERFKWQIYTPNFGITVNDLPGLEAGLLQSELERRILDALCMDDRILSIDKFVFSQNGEALDASFTVHTVFGDVQKAVAI